jgi:flavin-dependent thymidylate synthase
MDDPFEPKCSVCGKSGPTDFTPGCRECDPNFAPGTEVSTWVDDAMYEAAPMQSTMPKVHLLSATVDPLGAIAAACRMYEGKPTYDLKEVTDDEREHYWVEVNSTHLKAPLEFVKVHFFIEGVTRAFTHQMVRQRTAVYAQESLRFAVKTNMAEEIQAPPSIAVLSKRSANYQMWEGALNTVGEAYNSLVANGIPAEDARGLLPHAVTTRLHYCTDLRALLMHAGNRLCTQAQFEWRYVFMEFMKELHRYWGWQAEVMFNLTPPVFAPVCYEQGRCPFHADFDRGCTIRERVDAGKFDEIKVEEWLQDPQAGWLR